MITVVLVEPEKAGNVGAVARAMKNFGLERLVLINPKCDHLSDEAVHRATHSADILKAAKIADAGILNSFDYIIGTTALLGSDYNIPRSPLTPEEMAEKVAGMKSRTIAIVFGRESNGLTNEEIAKCDFVVSIPASKENSTLNLASSAAVIFYVLFRKIGKNRSRQLTPVSVKEKQIVLQKTDGALDKMEFSAPSKRETQKVLWKHIIGKAMLTRREAFALLGFLKKLK